MGDVSKVVETVVESELTKNLLGPATEATGQNISLKAREKRVKLWDREKKVIDAEVARQKYFLEQQYKLKEVEKLLAAKLENVDPDDIVDPEVYVAAPALRAISESMDSPDLRELYANLLAKSMQKDYKDGVHPSYVEIIRQLCPDEAKLLKYIYEVGKTPALLIRSKCDKDEFHEADCWSNICDLTSCEKSNSAFFAYYGNLKRLNLVEVYDGTRDGGSHDSLINHHAMIRIAATFEFKKCYIQPTWFGSTFCKTCISLD